jgi:hypothetical protein
MALPVGVTSALTHIDAPVSFGGTPAKVYLEVVPNIRLNHIATGTPLANFIDVRTPGIGDPATVTLPHTDQAGFQDESGLPVTNWSYAATIRYELDGQLIHVPTKHFQLLTGQTDIDLALIPVGEPTEIILGNVAFVSSVNGRSGAVTLAKSDVGLANVDNTSDVNKPVSTAQQTALNLKANLASPTFTGTVGGITKSMVGLSNVDNTADTAKPVSTAQQTALNLKANLASPTFTGTVGGITKSMVGLANVDNTADTAKPVSTAQQAALDLKAPLASPTFTGTVGGITKSMVGLSNVDNTSDANKPLSTAETAALALKANLASPTFTGTVGGITASMVGLGNVDNTSDANKPVSTAQQTALNLKVDNTTLVSALALKQDAAHTLNVRTATPYNVATTDDLVIANLGSAISFVLPDPGTVTVGKEFQIKNIGAGTLTVTSAGTSKTLDGAASQTFAQYVARTYYSNGSQWFTMN